jgi:hypothetical protein
MELQFRRAREGYILGVNTDLSARASLLTNLARRPKAKAEESVAGRAIPF